MLKYLKEEVKEKQFKCANEEKENWYCGELGEWTCRLRGIKVVVSP